MNKAQKILTVVALVIFCVIVVLCYVPSNDWVIDTPARFFRSGGFRTAPRGHYRMMIDNPALPILALAVLYAGAMALAHKKKTIAGFYPQRPPGVPEGWLPPEGEHRLYWTNPNDYYDYWIPPDEAAELARKDAEFEARLAEYKRIHGEHSLLIHPSTERYIRDAAAGSAPGATD